MNSKLFNTYFILDYLISKYKLYKINLRKVKSINVNMI
jgi:hypothetical protein